MKVWQNTRLKISGIGGVETHISSVSRELTKLGHDVYIGTKPPERWIENTSNPIVMHTHGDSWPDVSLIYRLRTNWSKHVSWVPICHGTTVGRVIACGEYFSLSGWRGIIRDFIPTLFADGAIAVGTEALREAKKYFRLRACAQVISNGTDPEIFAPLLKLSNKPHLIYVGRAEDRVKNISSLLDACRNIAEIHPDFELRAAPGIQQNPFVKNLGPLFGKDLASALGEARALILCSYYEGDPIVIHEAKALGLPVIASDISQLREALNNYPNSFFIDPKSVQSITEGIQKVLFDEPSLLPTPTIRSWRQVAIEFQEFYQQLLK